VGSSPWRRDPGPCPVDDTPHTACTPASIGPAQIVSRAAESQTVTVPVVRPGWLGATRPTGPTAPAQTVVAEFSTTTYTSRAIGRARRRR
jgi:hypothetical protein